MVTEIAYKKFGVHKFIVLASYNTIYTMQNDQPEYLKYKLLLKKLQYFKNYKYW